MKLIVGLKLRVVFKVIIIIKLMQSTNTLPSRHNLKILTKVCMYMNGNYLWSHPRSSKNLLALFAKTISPLWLIFIPRKLNERQLSHWLLFWSNTVSHEFISLKMSHLSQIDTVSLIFSQLCTPSQPHPPLPQLLTIKPPIPVHLSTGDQTRGSLSKPQKCKVSTTLWTYEKY